MGWDAKKVADELGYTLTSRDMGQTERVQLLGIPAHTLDTVVNELNRRDYHVVISDGKTVTERGHKPETKLSDEEEIDGLRINYCRPKSRHR